MNLRISDSIFSFPTQALFTCYFADVTIVIMLKVCIKGIQYFMLIEVIIWLTLSLMEDEQNLSLIGRSPLEAATG